MCRAEGVDRLRIGASTSAPRACTLRNIGPGKLPRTCARGCLNSHQCAAACTSQRHEVAVGLRLRRDRKSTRLNSSHLVISYAVFCLKKKKKNNITIRRSDVTQYSS